MRPLLRDSPVDKNQKTTRQLAVLCCGVLVPLLLVASGCAFLRDFKAIIYPEGSLHELVRVNHLREAERLILEKPESVHEWCGGRQPLHVGVESGNERAVKLLLDHGADVNAIGALGPPLETAARIDRAKIAETLIEHGADVHYRDELNHWTALHAAAYLGNRHAITVLVSAGADVNARTKTGETPLTLAQRQHPDGPTASLLRLLGGVE